MRLASGFLQISKQASRLSVQRGNGKDDKEASRGGKVSFLLFILMGRIEFPTTPIGATEKIVPSPVEQHGFVQPTLEGVDTEQTPEIELGNCLITATGRFKKRVRGNEWYCKIHATPDLLHPEQEGDFEAHAYNSYADMARSYHLRPGDRALMRGTVHSQTIALGNGETTIINHFSVTAIEVLGRSKRTSVTVYEQARQNGNEHSKPVF
jgi:hypothetical protein